MFYGAEGLSNAITLTKSQKALNAIVGFAGLRWTLECIDAGKEVALANKESLVAAGKFIDTTKITPVDSEHFALWYLNRGIAKIKKMTITASGGALRDAPLTDIYASSVKDVLKHPNWTMGRKITVDSATMVNKLFEIIEAYWLFGPELTYDAIIETTSEIIRALKNGKNAIPIRVPMMVATSTPPSTPSSVLFGLAGEKGTLPTALPVK